MSQFSQEAISPASLSNWRQMAAVAAIALSLAPAVAVAQGETSTSRDASAPYFVAPQEPQKLATLLYPPRVRSSRPVTNDSADVARFSMAIQFAYDSAKLQRQSMPMLDSIGQMMNLPKVRHEGLVIEGHTDARGPRRYNARLALRRAQAIKKYLAEIHDIYPFRMITVSFGETRLVNLDNPLDSRNRRVAFRPMRLEDLQHSK